jgi:hypothetical protein
MSSLFGGEGEGRLHAGPPVFGHSSPLGYAQRVRLGAVIVASAILLPAAALASSTARLVVHATRPFSVRGLEFKSGERVSVTLSATRQRTKSVQATSRGTFTVTFPAVSLGRCQAYAVRAKGNRGSTASLKVIPECAPHGPAGQPDAPMPKDPIPKKP